MIRPVRNLGIPATTMRRLGLVGSALILIAGALPGLAAGEETGQARKSRADDLAARRFELMRSRVAAGEVRSDEAGFPAHFSERPIYKYSDPARGYVAAAIWRLGDEGRPKALLVTELDRIDHGPPCISYEYISLTATPFTLSSDDMNWSPSRTPFDFQPLPRAAAPADTPQRRLRQLREMARRFASREEVKGERCELRLLPTPIARYTPSDAERADGAIFVFTFGTNPEVVLLIESDGTRWTYAAGRMTGAEVVALTLDGTTVWEGGPLEKGQDAPFTGSITPIDIPGIAADGSEIREP